MTAYAVVGGLILVLLFIVWMALKGAERKGRVEAERDHFQTESDTARRANEIDEVVMRMSDGELDRELRDGE